MTMIRQTPSAPTRPPHLRAVQSDFTTRHIGRHVVTAQSDMTDDLKEIYLQQGEITAYMKRAEEDRRDLKVSIEKVNDGQDALRQSVAGLQQTSQSTATTVAAIAAEGHGARISKLEEKMATMDAIATKVNAWDAMIGSTWSFIGKLAIGILSCSAVAGAAVGYVSHLLAKG